MSWWQLTIECTQQEIDTTEDILLSVGALSLTLGDAQDEPIYEPPPGETPFWSHTTITGLFEQSKNIEALFDDLVRLLPAHQVASIRKHELQDQQWERAFLDQFQPIQFGENLWVCPSWRQPPDPQACNIILDPGIAFGTGSHPTTALCLKYLAQHPPRDKSVLDFGCGSGILAIAAFQLGARSVRCTDIDPQALQATTQNAQRNQIDPQDLHITLPDAMDTAAVDYLIANILSGPLLELEAQLAALTRPGGQLVLSGILPQQAEQVALAYAPDFELDAITTENEWCRISGIKKS